MRRLGAGWLVPLLLWGLLAGAALPAQAAHYYALPSGSSSGDGSAGRPWNLATALSSKYGRARAGDTVWLMGGTYRGQDLVLPMSGLAVARPLGKSSAPPPTGPEFNVFVILTPGGGSDSSTPPVSDPPPSAPLPSSSSRTFTQDDPILLPDHRTASVYPSILNVSGMSGVIRKVTVTLLALRHSFPDDLDVLLVSPSGRKVLLMSDAGGDDPDSAINLVLDGAASPLPDYARLASRAYRPANYGNGDTFPAPAPAGPYTPSLSALQGDSPNGGWSLYMVDDERYDQGRLEGGWRLTLETGSSAGVQSLDSEPSIPSDSPTAASPGGDYDETRQFAPAVIHSVRREENGSTVLLVNWTPGQTYAVEASSDHRSWTPLALVVAATKSQEFADLEPGPQAQRFYRIRQATDALERRKEMGPEPVSPSLNPF